MSATPLVGAALPLAVLAAVMVGATIYLLRHLYPRRGGLPDLGTVVLVAGALIMMAGLWLSVAYAVLDPGDSSWTAVFLAINSMMALVGAWLIAVFLRAEERRLPARGWAWPSIFGLMILGNELLMGSTFQLVLSGPGPYFGAGGAGLLLLVSDAATSVWFDGAMLVTMVFLVLWLPFPRGERTALIGLSVSAAAGPWVVAAPLPGAIASVLLMTVVFAFLARELQLRPTPGFLRISRGVASALAVVAIAALIVALDRDPVLGPLPFVATTLLVMGVEVAYLGHAGLGFASPAADLAARVDPVSLPAARFPESGGAEGDGPSIPTI